jgi:hypothetical protein
MSKDSYNLDLLEPIMPMRSRIMREIEEAEWMEEDTSTLYLELHMIEDKIKSGTVYEPLF